MSALAVAIVGMTAIGLAALGVLFLADRSGQPALRRRRMVRGISTVLFDRTDGDRRVS